MVGDGLVVDEYRSFCDVTVRRSLRKKQTTMVVALTDRELEGSAAV